MTDRFESILDESISALQAGISIDDVLAEVPDYADELRPLLYASSLLTDPNPALAPAEKKSALRAEYLRQVAELSPLPSPSRREKMQAVLNIVRRRLRRKALINDLFTVLLTIVLTMGVMAATLLFLASETLPGDFLYSVKRIGEDARLAVTFDDHRQSQLAEAFNQRRLEEIEQLITLDRAAVVQFNGIVETRGDDLWVIEGYTVFVPDDLVVNPTIQDGDAVQVIGLLRTNNVLVVDTIRPIASE